MTIIPWKVGENVKKTPSLNVRESDLFCDLGSVLAHDPSSVDRV